jgi:hypothetical protein
MADELITVGNFQFVPEAEAARMHLEAEGILAFIADAETVNMDWFLGNAIGYIKLQVPAAQAAAARAALESMRTLHSQRAAASREGAEAPVCLACGAAFPVTQARCPACGWSYAAEQEEVVPEEQAPAEEEGPGSADAPSPMDTLRSLKRPFFWLLLSPFLLMAGILAFALLAWLVSALIP